MADPVAPWALYALYRSNRCRVLDYVGSGVFRLLDPSDTVRILHRSKFTFL